MAKPYGGYSWDSAHSLAWPLQYSHPAGRDMCQECSEGRCEGLTAPLGASEAAWAPSMPGLTSPTCNLGITEVSASLIRRMTNTLPLIELGRAWHLVNAYQLFTKG